MSEGEASVGPAGVDQVEWAHPIWYALVWGGIGLLAVIALSPDFYDYWTSTVMGLPDRGVMLIILWLCLPIHLFEGWYCHRLAHRIGLPESAKSWGWQAFWVGYPGTRLLLKRKRAWAAAQETA